MARKIKTLKDLFEDKNGKVVINQTPNPAVWGWAVFLILGHLLDSADLKWLSAACLFAWAFMELYEGVTYFRKFLGLLVLAYIIITHFAK